MIGLDDCARPVLNGCEEVSQEEMYEDDMIST